MLNKGWGKKHRGLAIFDLSTGMVIPYVLATSCVAIAAAETSQNILRHFQISMSCLLTTNAGSSFTIYYNISFT